ncbi:MAG: S41 family peptidase [Maribacter sp.]|uniref:S41 family peptidase n=1 Tax=Maribacter sp. TaxID=1897614 RepID=UPI0032990087
MRKIIAVLLISIVTFSCQNNTKKVTKKETVDLKGNWEYLGFGRARVIGDSIVESYHTSTAGNVRMSDNSVKDFFTYYKVDTLSNDTILIKDGVKVFKLFRSDTDFVQKVNDSLANDPKYNFEVLWNTFNEQYCYFKERNIDWDTMYETYAPQVKADTEPLELFLLFEKMLGEINDGHISIDVPDALEEAYQKQKAHTPTANAEDVPKGLEKKVKNLVIEKHLKKLGEFNQGELQWGMVNDDVAYIQTSNMISWAHYQSANSKPKEEFWEEWWGRLNEADNYHEDVAEGARFMMDSIVGTIENAKACIIDLRFNGGGFDDASIEILNHFVSQETAMGTKKVRLGQGFTEKHLITLTPSKKTFKRKVFVLTSHQTASAAEVLVLGSKEIPNARTVGSTTEGVFSDILNKRLPNGWNYGLSNMIYESMEGVSYEEVGITPDVKLAYPENSKDFYEYLLEDIKNGDDAIEQVLALVKAES